MKNIRDDVKRAVLGFVDQGQSFNSLDVYCTLGIRIDDNEYPIYEQVLDLFKNREMSSYLSEFVTLNLECGGYAKVWRYYKPRADVKTFPTKVLDDFRLEVPREALGHFPLFEEEMAVKVKDKKIILQPALGTEAFTVNTGGRVKIPAKIVKEAGIHLSKKVEVKAYLNRIEIEGD